MFGRVWARTGTAGAILVLSAFCGVAQQQPNAAPNSAQKPVVQSDSAAQLPDTPEPRVVSLAADSSAVESSSSSSSLLPAEKPRFWTSADPNAHVTVLENTRLRVISNEPLSSRHTREGAAVSFTLNEDVVVDNVLIIPRGAAVHGTVVASNASGVLTGNPRLVLRLTSLDFGGRSYPLYTYLFSAEGASKTRPTERKVRDGALIGAVVGGVFDGSARGQTTAVGKLAGMGTGAVLGAGVGTMVSAATPGPILTLPAESQMDFYLSLPIAVVPVSRKEAERLSEGLRRGGPVLYVRGGNS